METPETAELEEIAPVEKIFLDAKMEKYKLIAIATRWIEEISKKEEYKYLTFNQLLEVALKDILTGKVAIEEIKKLPPIERRKPKSAAPSGPSTAKKPKEYEPEKKSKKK